MANGYTAPTFSGMATEGGMGLPMQNQEWIDWFNSLTPEEQQQMRDNMARDFGSEQDVMAEQLKRAQGMRDTAMPEGRQAGRVYVAANPLEHANSAVKQVLGARDAKSTYDKMAAMRGDRQSMLSQMMRGYGGGNTSVSADPFSLNNEFAGLKGY